MKDHIPELMLRKFFFFFSLMVVLGPASRAGILIDFGPTAITSAYYTLDPAHNVGAISGAETSWNVVTTSVAGTGTALTNSDGSASAVTLFTGQGAVGATSVDYGTAITGTATLTGSGGGGTGFQPIFTAGSIYGPDTTASNTAPARDGFFGGGNGAAGSPIGLRIDGLTTGNYVVYIMGRNTNTRSAASGMNLYIGAGVTSSTFAFGSLTATNEANTQYTNGTTGTYNGQYLQFTAGDNYIALNVTVATGQSLFLASQGSSATETRGFFNSVQIAAVPEPSTVALLSGGLVFALGLVRWRSARETYTV